MSTQPSDPASGGAGSPAPATDGAPGPRRPSGRRRGDSGTRQAILDAAREQFAARGYDGASLRAIAAAAGVDPALIRHFHGSKGDLFAATVDFPADLPRRLEAAVAGRADGGRVAAEVRRRLA